MEKLTKAHTNGKCIGRCVAKQISPDEQTLDTDLTTLDNKSLLTPSLINCFVEKIVLKLNAIKLN